MKAIAITPGTPGAKIIQRPEPKLRNDHDVKLRVLRVGICGTDREELAGGCAQAPPSSVPSQLVIGHEMLGQVAALGASVTKVKVGDFAVFTVRRGCAACANCAMGRSDMCATGNYRERGIKGEDGYQTEFVVDTTDVMVPVPATLAAVGVLLEPLSIVEKAIDEALRLQALRDPVAAISPAWLTGRRCLVAGLGPVGLLAAMVLTQRGGEVYGLDVADAASLRPQWLLGIGGRYLDGRQPDGRDAAQAHNMDFVLDASGVAAVEFQLLDALARNGIYVVTGIPGGGSAQLAATLRLPAAELVRRLVLDNQAMIGSVNAAHGHFQRAVDDLADAHRRWGAHLERLITHRHTPDAFVASLATVPPRADDTAATTIKEVVEWA